MKKATNLKLLESEEIKNMSFEDVFLSSQYKYDIQQLSNTAVKRTGCERSPLVRVLNDINDGSVAYTDGNKVTINFGNPFASRLRTNYPVYHIYVVGLLAHELGHIFYTDFDDSIKYMNEIGKGNIYPEKPVHKNADAFEESLKDENNRKLIQAVAHTIDNILEDIYVNRMQSTNLGGLYARGIALGNKLVADEAPTVEKQKENENSDFTIIMNLFLSRIKSGVAYYGKYESDYRDKVENLMSVAVGYIFGNNHQNRCRGSNVIMCELWDELSEMLEKAKNNSDDNNDNESSDETDNEDNGEGDSSDNESNSSNSSKSVSSKCSDSETLDRLKKILKQIEGQTKNTENNNTSKTAKAFGNEESSINKSNSEDVERMPETEGEAVSVNGGEFSDEELEAIRAIRKIQKDIVSERVEEKIEKEIYLELNEIVPKNLPDIHKNVSYYVNRPTLQPSDKNCYDVIATRYKDVVQSLVKVVKRIIKAENLTGERRGRYYGKSLDTSKLYRPDLKIFKDRKQPKKEISLALSVLIDESGSMSGQRCRSARNASIVLAEMCEQLNVPYEVFGHTALSGRVYLNNYKNFDSLKKDDKYRLAQVDASFSNRDGAAILYVTERLKQREEQNKLFIIISDGEPADIGYYGDEAKSDLKYIHSQLISSGVDLIAAAIGSDKEVIHQIYGQSFLDVTNLETMPEIFARILKKKIVN